MNYGEADRVVHVLTTEGRLSLFAHAARKSRRRFGGALDPFTTIRMHIEPRRRAGMPTLGSATVVLPRLGLRADLDRIALAAYVVELGAAVAPEGDPAAGLYRLVEAALDRLESTTPSVALRRAFELRLIDVLGYAPLLDRCCACDGPIEDVAYLDFIRGGLVCEEDRDGAGIVGPKTVEWMQRVLAAVALDELVGVSAEWADTAARKLTVATSSFFERLIGRTLKSSDLLADLSL